MAGEKVCVRTAVFVRARLQSCREGSTMSKASAAAGSRTGSQTDLKGLNQACKH